MSSAERSHRRYRFAIRCLVSRGFDADIPDVVCLQIKPSAGNPTQQRPLLGRTSFKLRPRRSCSVPCSGSSPDLSAKYTSPGPSCPIILKFLCPYLPLTPALIFFPFAVQSSVRFEREPGIHAVIWE